MTIQTHLENHAVRYRAYGHILGCSSPLHELEQSAAPDASGPADLHIVLSSSEEPIPTPTSWYLTVSLPDGTPWLRCAKIAAGYLLRFPGLAGFVFSPWHNSIRCIPHRHTPAHTVNHLLLDQVLPLVLNYRGKEVLHGAAVATPYGACAFLGPAGSGKSTLAASFLSAGYSVLTDDCVVLDRCGEDIVTIPAYPGLRLWDDAIDALFGTTKICAPVAHYTRKQRFPDVASATPCPSVISLAGIYVIETSSPPHTASAITLERPTLTQREALMTLLSLAFKLDIEDQSMLTREFDFLHHLVTRVPVRRLIIPDSFQALPGIRADILHDLARSC
ncbi:MAG: hypothetical protein CV081_08825 [Nitrospira sp. LK265]|nr:hypothetical protein [Nitrospira sp.]NGZ60589.1 hypothetical protein [Nitrospira sp. LK265]